MGCSHTRQRSAWGGFECPDGQKDVCTDGPVVGRWPITVGTAFVGSLSATAMRSSASEIVLPSSSSASFEDPELGTGSFDGHPPEGTGTVGGSSSPAG